MEDRLYRVVKVVLILLCIAVLLLGCVFLGLRAAQKAREQEEALQASIDHYIEHNQTVTSFPHRLKINGKTAYLRSIDLFETKVQHGYVAYMIITIDRGKLTDDDMYWILKGYRYDWELDAYATMHAADSNADSESLHFLDCVYSDSHIYFFFYTDQQRESMQGRAFSASINYLKDGADASDKYHYFYTVDFVRDQYHDSAEFLPLETAQILLDSLNDATS